MSAKALLRRMLLKATLIQRNSRVHELGAISTLHYPKKLPDFTEPAPGRPRSKPRRPRPHWQSRTCTACRACRRTSPTPSLGTSRKLEIHFHEEKSEAPKKALALSIAAFRSSGLEWRMFSSKGICPFFCKCCTAPSSRAFANPETLVGVCLP